MSIQRPGAAEKMKNKNRQTTTKQTRKKQHKEITESQDIPSWKGRVRFIKSNSWGRETYSVFWFVSFFMVWGGGLFLFGFKWLQEISVQWKTKLGGSWSVEMWYTQQESNNTDGVHGGHKIWAWLVLEVLTMFTTEKSWSKELDNHGIVESPRLEKTS